MAHSEVSARSPENPAFPSLPENRGDMGILVPVEQLIQRIFRPVQAAARSRFGGAVIDSSRTEKNQLLLFSESTFSKCTVHQSPSIIIMCLPRATGICSTRSGRILSWVKMPFLFIFVSSLPSGATGTNSTNQRTCTLCDNGQYPSDETARFRVSDEIVLNCSQMYNIAPTLTDEADCMGIQNIGRTICECNPEEKVPCTLCSDGSPLPDADVVIYAGTTCADLEERAANDFASNCEAWQSTAGFYCKCPSNVGMEKRCSICPGEALPDPFKMVLFENGGSKSCLELEVEINRSQGDCGRYQQLYAERCGCFDLDKGADYSGDDSSNDLTSGANASMACKSMLLAMATLITCIA